ncbi:uncharacterized protein K444DRAFT_637534 [Hyaloscypha bicolor E]|uniref:Uncharacterized protein n=1 Tax=Hyaloscypha bicolor E TaxID=1095630 RepID=A0A2J6SH55_9HELO|nr:uncharacterized protein K444DRAFT_637534 [Hyaloscypha bicolor E]PMD50106.1 hypothetical protein K444DRAFT_637534 [Hyaloscypha bicolor E]
MAWQAPIGKPATPSPPANQQPIKSPINNREQLAQKSKGELKLALEKLSMKKKELREKQTVKRTSLEDDLSYMDNLHTSNPGLSALPNKYSSDLQKQSSRETSRLQFDGNFQERNTINRNDGTNEGLKQSSGVGIKPETKREVRIKLEEVAEPSLGRQNVLEGSHQRALIDDLEKYVQTQGQVHVPPADNFLETSLKRLKLPPQQELSVPEPTIPSRDASPTPASNVDKFKWSKIRDPMDSLVNSSFTNQVSDSAINNPTPLGKILSHSNKQVMAVWPLVNDVPTGPHTWANRPSLAKPERDGLTLNGPNHLSSCETLEEHPDKDTLTREQTVEKKTPSVAGSSKASVASSFEPDWCLRYASMEEHQNLLRSVDEEKYQARLNGSYLPPKIPEHCFADPDWLPYHCFTCDQTRNTCNGLKTHLRLRHSTIMVDKDDFRKRLGDHERRELTLHIVPVVVLLRDS